MFCPNCGEQNPDGAQFCQKCGATMTGGAAAQAQQPAQPVDRGVVPDEIKGFNFGAFALNWIWAAAHGLWGWTIGIIVSSCVFPVTIVLMIILGIKGNEYAWKKRAFTSVQQFKETQRVWTIAGVIYLAASFLFVIPMIAILAAVAVPNFLSAKDKATFMMCYQSLSGVKVAQEMHITDYGVYADDPDRLATYMIPGCTEEDGSDCAGQVIERISGSCESGSFAIRVSEDGFDYEVRAKARTQRDCEICVTPMGAFPDNYGGCTAEAICPAP